MSLSISNCSEEKKEKEKISLTNNIYGTDNKKLDKHEVKSEIENYWKNIYEKHKNNIKEV